MKVHRRTDFFGRESSDLGVGGWVSCNMNVVRICKSVRNIGQSLRDIPIFTVFFLSFSLFVLVEHSHCLSRLILIPLPEGGDFWISPFLDIVFYTGVLFVKCYTEKP